MRRENRYPARETEKWIEKNKGYKNNEQTKKAIKGKGK